MYDRDPQRKSTSETRPTHKDNKSQRQGQPTKIIRVKDKDNPQRLSESKTRPTHKYNQSQRQGQPTKIIKVKDKANPQR